MKIHLFFSCFALFLFSNCQSPEKPQTGNPPAQGFDESGSDKKAISIADGVMEAMGGRKNWDEARYFSWVFFGARKHVWDKQTGDIRVESNRDSTIYLMNVNTMEGKVSRKGQLIKNPDTLQLFLKRGKSIWINDSYWLVMPFKLKDSGVTLTYEGERQADDGNLAEVLQMTFKDVGDTPNNKYEIFVDKNTRLVSAWSFFRNAEQDTSNFTMPWLNYERHGKLMLSGDRGQRKLTDISVNEQLPPEVFTSF